MLSASEGWSVWGAGDHSALQQRPLEPASQPDRKRFKQCLDGFGDGRAGPLAPMSCCIIRIATIIPMATGQRVQPIPSLASVAMDSASDGWAVGSAVIAHYHDGAWTTVTPSFPLTGIMLISVVMASPGAVSAAASRLDRFAQRDRKGATPRTASSAAYKRPSWPGARHR